MPRVQPRLLLIALVALACNSKSSDSAMSRTTLSDSGTFAASVANAAVPTSAPDTSIRGTVAAVTNDVKSLRVATPDAAVGQLPTHEKLVTGMLDNFESRIRAMHVQADPSWTSVIDSVRTDLVKLPAMPAASLASYLPQHLNRVMRIVACIQMVKS